MDLIKLEDVERQEPVEIFDRFNNLKHSTSTKAFWIYFKLDMSLRLIKRNLTICGGNITPQIRLKRQPYRKPSTKVIKIFDNPKIK